MWDCSVLDGAAIRAKARSENFPVASRLLPRTIRAHLLAIYDFARLADDIGDEVAGDRLALLDWLEAELDHAVLGGATHPVLQRLAPTIHHCGLPLAPFRALIAANRQDQAVRRYDSIDDLIAYCRLSAVPVGRLVLGVFGMATPDRTALADDVCIGLQLVEHLQDVKEDLAHDRIYLPQRDLRAFGCVERDLRRTHAGPRLRALVRHEVGRARGLLRSAVPLARSLPLQPRLAVCGFAGGGQAALDAIGRAGYDVLARRCRPRPSGVAIHAVVALAGSMERR